MVYNSRRTWYQWTFMKWVVGASVRISDSDVKLLTFKTSRWWFLAYCHMVWISWKLEKEYYGCMIETWLDWEN